MTGIGHGKFIKLHASGVQVDVYYHENGPEGGQPTIFAQTGGAGTSAYMCWYLNMSPFAEAGYHVYAPDFVGYGLTQRVSEEDGRIDTSEFILAFMDTLQIGAAHFIGNSMGSNAITRFAFEHSGRVKSLILTGGEPIVETEESRVVTKTLGRTARTDFVGKMLDKPEVTFDDMKKATADFFYDPDNPRIDEVAKIRLGDINRPGVRKKALDHAQMQTNRGRAYFQSTDLQKIQAPTYLIHGRDERFFFPKDAASVLLTCAMKAVMVIPNCSCTILSHCGHWPQIEKANTFNALSLEFLERLRGELKK